jgi:fused signal recognition particle receptor
MPTGVGFDVIVAGALVLLLAASVLVARLQKETGPEAEASASPGGESAGQLGQIAAALLASGAPTEEEWGRFEQALLAADLRSTASRRLLTGMRDRLRPGKDPGDLLVDEVTEFFGGDPPLSVPDGLAVLMIVGPVGSGKTVTAAKLAFHLTGRGRLVTVAACGTLGAASVADLARWAELAGADVAVADNGLDPGAVSYRAVESTRARGSDVLVVDAAGRTDTLKQELEELARIRRVLEKAARRVDEVLLCLDATTRPGDLPKARSFVDAVGVTGIAVTKFDMTRVPGMVLAARGELRVPVKLVGTGEEIRDLREFDPRWFARALMVG